MMDFSFGGVGLAPHHYVEIKKNPLFATMGVQEQRLLILKHGDTDLYRSLSDEKKGEEDARFTEEKKLVQGVNPILPIFGLVYKDIQSALVLLPEIQFTQLVWFGENEAELLILRDFLSGRWKSPEEIDGHLFIAKSGALPEIKQLAHDLENYHISIFPTFSNEKKDEPIWAITIAAVNAQLAFSPQKPYSQVELPGLVTISPPKLQERNELLAAGVSTIRMNGKRVLLDRMVTTQSKNDAGVKDPCFRDVNTKQILSYLRYDLKQYFSTIFSRMSLARDDFAYGGDVITPKAAKSLVIARFRKWQEQSLVQDPEERFSKDVRVEVDAKNPTKLNFYLPIVVMGQLYTTQTQICFSL